MKINFYKVFKSRWFFKFQTSVYILYKVLTKHTKTYHSYFFYWKKERNRYHCPLVTFSSLLALEKYIFMEITHIFKNYKAMTRQQDKRVSSLLRPKGSCFLTLPWFGLAKIIALIISTMTALIICYKRWYLNRDLFNCGVPPPQK